MEEEEEGLFKANVEEEEEEEGLFKANAVNWRTVLHLVEECLVHVVAVHISISHRRVSLVRMSECVRACMFVRARSCVRGRACVHAVVRVCVCARAHVRAYVRASVCQSLSLCLCRCLSLFVVVPVSFVYVAESPCVCVSAPTSGVFLPCVLVQYKWI